VADIGVAFGAGAWPFCNSGGSTPPEWNTAIVSVQCGGVWLVSFWLLDVGFAYRFFSLCFSFDCYVDAFLFSSCTSGDRFRRGGILLRVQVPALHRYLCGGCLGPG